MQACCLWKYLEILQKSINLPVECAFVKLINMTALIRPRRFTGLVTVPPSKSHTIRRLLMAAFTDGVSEIINPLDSLDTRSCVSVCRALGAEVTEKSDRWFVRGSSFLQKVPVCEKIHCDVGNSGTTLFLALAAASLGTAPVTFDGDAQVRLRSANTLLEALAGLGASVSSASHGCIPISVCGPWKGGKVSLSCRTSQYLSALLLAAPLAPKGVVTEIDVPLLNERSYVEMTLSYLDEQGVPYEAAGDLSYFKIPGGFSWKPMSGPVPGDFSSAAFPAAAAAITKGKVTLLGLEPDDTQGDKAFFGFLEKMGCRVQWEQVSMEKVSLGQFISNGLKAVGQKELELNIAEWQLHISRQGPLTGGEFNLNDTPDLLPVLAAVACFADGDTALFNVAHARIKETDRIAVMAEELKKLGVKTSEYPDGLVIHGKGGIPKALDETCKIDSRHDHRVFMALACAALGCPQTVELAGAESADITYPGFLDLIVA